jgi:hypothetical protein
MPDSSSAPDRRYDGLDPVSIQPPPGGLDPEGKFADEHISLAGMRHFAGISNLSIVFQSACERA